MTTNTDPRPPTDQLRAEFLRLLTEDSETKDRRRREFNQAIFRAPEGYAIWSSTDLDMVMDKFDQAVCNLSRPAVSPIRRRRHDAARAMYGDGR